MVTSKLQWFSLVGYFPAHSILQWYKGIYPHLKDQDKPLECIQKPGEILYLVRFVVIFFL